MIYRVISIFNYIFLHQHLEKNLMSYPNAPKIQQQEETSPFKAQAFSKQAIHAISTKKQIKTIKVKNNLLIPALAILSLTIAFSYYTQTQNRNVQQKIIAFTEAQNKLQPSISPSPKPDITSNRPTVPETEKEDINFDLFDDDKKVTKSPRTETSKDIQLEVKADEKNPIMKTFLEGVNKTLEKDMKISQIIEKMLKSGSQKNFVLPKKVWIYSQDQEKEILFIQKCIENAKRVAKESGFQVTVVNKNNLQKYVPAERVKKVTDTLATMSREAIQNPVSGYEPILEPTARTLVLLEILHEKGGIILDKSVILTEDFSWLIGIANNQYANCGNPDYPTNYFAFHNVNFTSNEQIYNNSDGTWKYIAKQVGLESFFLAGKPKGQFIQQILKMLYILYSNPQSVRETLAALRIGKAITNLFIVTNAFPISCRIVLKQKQRLSEKGLLAIDYYGIKSINSYYFPKKLNHYFEYSFQEKILTNLAKYSLEELEETVGPLKYMAIVPYDSYIDDRLTRLLKTVASPENSQMYLLHPKSFLAKYIVPDLDKSAFMEELETNKVDPNGEVWANLPKIVWTEQPANKKRNIIEWITYQNILKYAKDAGFEVRQVNPLNFQEWLNKYEIDWIKNTAEKAKTKIFNKMKMEMAKLHILIRYGGIWISKHYFALQSLEWVRKITSYPTQYVFNRYGNTPSVLMYFHPHYGQPLSWVYDPNQNTKNMWHVALDSNFIAAQPDAQLLKDWVRTFTKFLSRPYNQNLNEMARLKVDTQRWTVKENAYFAMLDAVKMVIGNKEREINNLVTEDTTYKGPKSAAEFYKVWSICGAQGPLMLDNGFSSLSVERGSVHPRSNTLIWRYPKEYLQGIIGKVHKIGRLYHINSAELVRIISKTANLTELTSQQIHPRSFFYQQLYKSFQTRISRKGADFVFN